MTTMNHGESIPNQVMGDTKHPLVDNLTAGMQGQGAPSGMAQERVDLLKNISAGGYAPRHNCAGGRTVVLSPHLLVIGLESAQSALEACLSAS